MAEKSLNQVQLIGRIGSDAETRYTQSGTAVSNFSVATNRRWKDNEGGVHEDVDWHQAVLWRGENLAPYLTRGARVYVEGRLQTRSYESQERGTQYATEVVVNQVILLGNSNQSNGNGHDAAPGPGRPQNQAQPQQGQARPQSQAPAQTARDSGSGSRRPAQQRQQSQNQPAPPPADNFGEITDDDVPF